MPDPFLYAHGVAPRQFELGGSWSPLSIRDQMVRARMFFVRAVREGVIDRSRGLFVVGAGAAGVTVALLTAGAGIPTFLLDRDGAPFSRQASCLSRWVDPTQYDWPHPVYAAGAFPAGPPPMPLPWHGARAATLATAWRHRLRGPIPNLTMYFRCEVSGIMHMPAQRRLRVFYGPPGQPSHHRDVGALVSAIGFGAERCDVDDLFRGWAFWETDPIESPNMGLSGHVSPHVLISGGGDGALQDFIRVVTGLPSAAALLRHIGGIPSDVEGQLLAVEEASARAYVWGTGPRDDHSVLEAKHVRYAQTVAQLAAGPHWPRIRQALRTLPISSRADVDLCFSCTHFGHVYGLNRLLVLLLERFLIESDLNTAPLHPGERLVHIVGRAGHACAQDPYLCHGQRHAAAFAQVPDCRGPGPITPPITRDYNVIVVRHGIEAPAYVIGSQPAAAPRQILPYHAPL